MQLPEHTKEATSKVYSFILDGLAKKFPELRFDQLLLPDWNTYISGTTLSEHIMSICANSLFAYGKLSNVFIFRYRCDLDFDYHGVKHTVCIDYRKPERCFTDEFLSRFRQPHEPQYHELYWETNSRGMPGDPHSYVLCKTCLKKKPIFLYLSGLFERFKLHFQGSV